MWLYAHRTHKTARYLRKKQRIKHTTTAKIITHLFTRWLQKTIRPLPSCSLCLLISFQVLKCILFYLYLSHSLCLSPVVCVSLSFFHTFAQHHFSENIPCIFFIWWCVRFVFFFVCFINALFRCGCWLLLLLLLLFSSMNTHATYIEASLLHRDAALYTVYKLIYSYVIPIKLVRVSSQY